jgi:hypothetical protein
LDGEIDGEGVFLKGGKLGTGQDAEGDDAGNEGLEESGAQEGTIAVWLLIYMSVCVVQEWEAYT